MKKLAFIKASILIISIFFFKHYLNNNWFRYKDLELVDLDSTNLDAEFWEKKNNRLLYNESNRLVTLIDLNSHLKPINLYKAIQCRKSQMHIVQTTLCVHDIERDIHVSGSIWRDGIWEEHVLKPFVYYLNEHPDSLVIDIGAQIGQYTLFAAQMGMRVLTVEPFYDSILRLHKAAYIERVIDRITLIQNAISNKRNETKFLEPSSDNIGGQSLLNNQHKTYVKNANNKYLVQTILFDDLIPYLPKTNEGKMYKKAILKIDIEGFEPYAFQHAAKLFDAIDIQIIFMEWGTLMKESSLHNFIIEMVEFLVERNYSAYGNNKYLEPIRWGTWDAWDIIWKKNLKV